MSSVDINSWQSLFPKAIKEQRVFVTQLVRHLSESLSPGGLAQSLSGSNRGVGGGALKNFTQDYPSGGSETANVANSYAVHVSMELTILPATLSLQNLLTGSPVSIQVTNTTGSAGNFFINATNGSGVAYTVFAKGSTLFNMVSTGVSIGAGVTLVFSGNSSVKGSTPDLEFVYN